VAYGGRGVTTEGKREQLPGRRVTIWGRRITAGGVEWLRRAPKSPNNVSSTFFSTVHLLPKISVSNMGALNLLLAPGAI